MNNKNKWDNLKLNKKIIKGFINSYLRQLLPDEEV